MRLKEISPRISYLPASWEPLSADVGIVRGETGTWIFDVGASEEAVRVISEIGGVRRVVLSHFHRDHIGNLPRVSYDALYCGDYTRRKAPDGRLVSAPLAVDGVVLFPIPSPHVKGAVGLLADGYAFVGDALHPGRKGGRPVYNFNTLAETIRAIGRLPAETLLLSHAPGLARKKEDILETLRELLSLRKLAEALLVLEDAWTETLWKEEREWNGKI